MHRMKNMINLYNKNKKITFFQKKVIKILCNINHNTKNSSIIKMLMEISKQQEKIKQLKNNKN